MPKHTDTNTDPRALAVEIARILDLEATRFFDGHFVISGVEGDQIEGAVLHAHDKATVLTFTLTVTAS